MEKRGVLEVDRGGYGIWGAPEHLTWRKGDPWRGTVEELELGCSMISNLETKRALEVEHIGAGAGVLHDI